MKTLKSFVAILSLCMLLASCGKEDYEPWKPEPIDPDKINWEECLVVGVSRNKVDPENQFTIAGVYLHIAIVGEEPIQRVEGWGRTLRIVNYGKEKILFSSLGHSATKYYETIWTSAERWDNGLGIGDKTPNTKYVRETLAAQVGTYEFCIELIRDTERQTSPHYRSPRYRLTMDKNGEDWSLSFEQVK